MNCAFDVSLHIKLEHAVSNNHNDANDHPGISYSREHGYNASSSAMLRMVASPAGVSCQYLAQNSILFTTHETDFRFGSPISYSKFTKLFFLNPSKIARVFLILSSTFDGSRGKARINSRVPYHKSTIFFPTQDGKLHLKGVAPAL